MPISCEDCRDQLSEMLEAETAAAPQVAAHLATCAACARDLSLLRQMRAELRALPMMAAPQDLRARVQAELRQSQLHSAPPAVLPVSGKSGWLAGLSDFFRRPANVAWTSGFALAAFCLLLVARPQQNDLVVTPVSSPPPQREVTIINRNGAKLRPPLGKAGASRSSAPASGSTTQQAPAENQLPKAPPLTKGRVRVGSDTQQTPSPALPSGKGKGVLPTLRTDSQKPDSANAMIASKPVHPAPAVRSILPPGSAPRTEKIRSGNALGAGNFPPQVPTERIKPNAGNAPLSFGSPPRAPARSTRSFRARLEWLPGEVRREVESRSSGGTNQAVVSKEQALSKPALRDEDSRGGGFDAKTGAGARARADKPKESAQRQLQGTASNAPAAAAPAAAGGVQGPAGSQGAADALGLEAATARENSDPANAMAATKSSAADSAADRAEMRAAGKREVLEESERLAMPATTLHVGERRVARLVVVPPRDLRRASVWVTPTRGVRLEGQSIASVPCRVWTGSTQAGRAITISLVLIGVSPGAQTLRINLRAPGQDANVAGDSEILILSVLPR